MGRFLKLLFYIWLLTTVSLSAVAFADNLADEADLAFRLGNDAYTKHRYREALAAYFLSNRLVPNKNVLYNIARCYEALKSFDEAYRYYYELSVAKDLEARDAEDARRALQRLEPKVSLLEVSSQPSGAEVFIDREDLGSRGRTPLVLALSSGTHKVQVKLEGRHPAEMQARVTRGAQKKISFKLDPIVGKVEIRGTPEGATVKDTQTDAELCRIPCTVSMPLGQHLLSVSSSGYQPSQLLATVNAQETISLKVELNAIPVAQGKVIVTANHEGATVRVDGRESGFTPTVLLLPVGSHEIEVSHSDYRPYVQSVHVTAKTDVKVMADLRYAPARVRAANKSLSDADDVAASVTLITREEIQSMGYQTLAEAIAAIRGVQVHNDRIYSYLGFRGLSPPGDLNTRVLILWDGHPFNDVWAGQGYAERSLNVDLSEVERIEIVRGPGSALYGTGAFFAVINVVPRDIVGSDKHVEGAIGAGGVAAVKVRATGSLGSNSGPSALVTAAALTGSGAPNTPLQEGTVKGNDSEQAANVGLRAKLKDFSLQGQFTARSKQIPVPIYGTQLGAPGTQYSDMRGFAELRWEHSWERMTLAARAYYDMSLYNGSYAYLVPGSRETIAQQFDFGGAHWGGVEVRSRIRLFADNVLSVGIEGQFQAIQHADAAPRIRVEDFSRILLSAYLLDEWKIISRLSVTLGVRVDKYLDIDTPPITPRLGLVLKPYTRGTTKLMAGSAFRAPNIFELQQSDGNLTQRTVNMPLQSETIYTLELEHAHDFTEELRVSVGGFFNVINSLVVLEQDREPMPRLCGVMPSAPDMYCLVNVNSQNAILATGGEAQLHWQPRRFLFVDLAYSYVRLFDAARELHFLTSQHLLSAKAVVPLLENTVRFSTQATYASPRSGTAEAETFLWNLGFSGQLNHFRYFAGVQNLLDNQLRVPTPTGGYTTPVPLYGRTFWLELGLLF